MPRVSVVLPTYNCSAFLGKAIDSVLAQSYKDYEIIVVDDGSTDHTSSLMAHYEKHTRYFYQNNKGVSAARNLALMHATGEFIAYLDADDIWYPAKLAQQVAFLDAHPDCGLVHTEVSVIDDEDNLIHFSFNRETQRPVPYGYCLTELLQRSHIQTLTVLERARCIAIVGNFDEHLPVVQDYDHWIRVAIEGFSIGYLEEPLGKYRWRRGSLMRNEHKYVADLVAMYEGLLRIPRAKNPGMTDEMKHIIHEQLYRKERELAYLDRTLGRYADAKRRLRHLLRTRPSRVELCIDFVKVCMSEILKRGDKTISQGTKP
jgi:glycosyltransferase involved in cell wall biosynthesis